MCNLLIKLRGRFEEVRPFFLLMNYTEHDTCSQEQYIHTCVYDY